MKVLCTLPYYDQYCKSARQQFEANGFEVISNQLGRPMAFDNLKGIVGEIDGAVVGVDEWDEKLFKLAPNLKAIARFGVGIDNINLDDAKTRNITVTNCPGVNTASVAEHALMLILCTMRHLTVVNSNVRKGIWVRAMHHELKGMTVGLIGFGAIAKSLAERLKPFGVELIAYDKFPNIQAAESLGVKLLCFDDVMRYSDVISLHIPATSQTSHLINEKALSLAKDSVYIINTSRGTVVDENAIYKALKADKIAGFGTDVYESEPPNSDNPLFEFEQVVFTPHIAAESYESWATTGLITAQAIIDIFAGKEPENKIV